MRAMVPLTVPGSEPAVRVLHITADLVFGGVENWLLSMVRLLTAEGLRMDLAVTGTIDPRVQAKFEASAPECLPARARMSPCGSLAIFGASFASRSLRHSALSHASR